MQRFLPVPGDLRLSLVAAALFGRCSAVGAPRHSWGAAAQYSMVLCLAFLRLYMIALVLSKRCYTLYWHYSTGVRFAQVGYLVHL